MWALVVVCVGMISTVTAQGAAPTLSAGTRQVLLDMLKNLMAQTGPAQPFKGASPFIAPPPPPQMALPVQQGPPSPNDGVFMDMPQTGGYGGAVGGYGATGYGAGGYSPMMRKFEYCPPGPTTADHCKDQKLAEALYFPDGTPRYNWVPPKNPWDNSLPDTVKETARNILMMKVNQRPNRTPTPKEWELMSLLGDPKEQGMAGNPFAGR